MSVVHLALLTGQSLATGYNSTAYTTAAPAGTYNKKCSTGGIVMVDYAAPNASVRNAGSLVSLVEASVETGVAACCNWLSDRYPEQQFIGASAGVPGTPLASRIKGTSIYNAMIGTVTAINSLVTANGDRLRVLPLCNVDGESDAYSGAAYYTNVIQFGPDAEADIQAITLQPEAIPLILSQPIGPTGGTYDTSQAMLDAALAYPDRIFLAGPKYQLTSSDDLHLVGQYGYTVMGTMYAQAIQAVAFAGQRWRGCLPLSARRSGAVVRVTYDCAIGPVQLDAGVVSNPGNYGFEWYDSTSSATVSSVAVVAPNAIDVALSGTPTGASKALRYAFTATPTREAGGPVTGRRGCVRDAAGNYSASFNFPAT